MHVRVRLLPIALVTVLCTGGCTSFSDQPGAGSEGQGLAVSTSAPDKPLTVMADADPVTAAATMSSALFDRSPVAVAARDGDRAGPLLASSAAVGLGVPLLLEPKGDGEPVTGEIGRLGTGTVLGVGLASDGATEKGAGQGNYDVVDVPSDARAVAAATGLKFASADPVSSSDDPATVAALDPAAPVALRLEGSPASSSATRRAGSLPEVDRADPLARTVVLATGDEASTAAIATARAAGATVSLTGGQTDPRKSGAGHKGLATAKPETAGGLGGAFPAEGCLDWKR